MNQSETLKSCPLCGGEAYDKGYGISCVKCGLWLGNGTQAIEHGGYKKLWNHRLSEGVQGTGDCDLTPE